MEPGVASHKSYARRGRRRAGYSNHVRRAVIHITRFRRLPNKLFHSRVNNARLLV